MRTKPSKTIYRVLLEYANGVTREVTVKASSLEVAEARARKRNPSAVGVKVRG